ncbi:DUF1540 domain-containing protein [Clostridium sardiniense]|uniref:DUF1540 domain-containing protein n=1 Tax=Clostridium sardiniense TaxID=29369 RepID=A0ABS7L1U2_CLOSR|nr:DUF1540 domain-containing protein [Clostridium sardiniense]MBM7836577.1 hypothetical protein [Clostridium sardiniense]MBY0757048.1 DUF1540 domain-containing protein [Clostridium sardiniense]MDQ0462075.1 hypothetical protein [Clostridium sardiniense]
MDKNHNSSIKCIVDECKYHCKDDDYCTLNVIEVGKHEIKAESKKCTDCNSFELD